MTPITSFSGLASGIDTARIVEELVKLERRPIDTLQRKQGDISAISRRLNDLKSKMNAMADAAGGLDDRSEVLVSTGTSSDESVATLSADGGAALGTYALEVTSLARSQRTHSDAIAQKNQMGLFGEGDLTITVGADAPINVTIDASDTLETVASKINASGADVTAGLIFDGTNYRLMVGGNQTGAAEAVTFAEGGTLALGLDNPANTSQAATDAAFTVDGFAMTRTTNTVVDAIPGVTIELGAQTTAPVSLNITRDTEALKEGVQAFVDAFNEASGAINSEFVFSGNPVLGVSLSGDAMLRGLQNRLRREATSVLATGTAPYNRLSGIGVTLQSDGSLKIDDDAFQAAVGADPEAVATMLAGTQAEPGLMSAFDDLVNEYTRSGDGLIAMKVSSLDDRSRDYDRQIDRMEVRIDSFEQGLRVQFAAMEQLVSSLSSQGSQMMAILGSLQG